MNYHLKSLLGGKWVETERGQTANMVIRSIVFLIASSHAPAWIGPMFGNRAYSNRPLFELDILLQALRGVEVILFQSQD